MEEPAQNLGVPGVSSVIDGQKERFRVKEDNTTYITNNTNNTTNTNNVDKATEVGTYEAANNSVRTTIRDFQCSNITEYRALYAEK